MVVTQGRCKSGKARRRRGKADLGPTHGGARLSPPKLPKLYGFLWVLLCTAQENRTVGAGRSCEAEGLGGRGGHCKQPITRIQQFKSTMHRHSRTIIEIREARQDLTNSIAI